MFETIPSAEIKLPEALAQGMRSWRYVFRTVEAPLFLARYRERGDAAQSLLFLGSVQELVSFLRAHLFGGTVLRVQLLSPGWFNGSQDWALHNLVELWSGVTGKTKAVAYKYVLENGSCFICTELGVREPVLVNETLLFSASQLEP